MRSQSVRINRDLVRPGEAAKRRDLRDPFDGSEICGEVPLLIGAQVCKTVPAGAVDEGVLEHPADGGGIWPEGRSHALRQALQRGREVLERLGPRPRRVGSVLEEHGDE